MRIKSTIQRGLDEFFKEVEQRDYNIKAVSKGAFSQARAKLHPYAFIRLNEIACKTFYENAPYLGWRNLRLVAVDGSQIKLPNHPSIKEKYGEIGYGPNADSMCSMGRVSLLYDVSNLLVIDAAIEPLSVGERKMFINQLDKLGNQDLGLFDRGYQGVGIMLEMQKREVNFCMRVKEKLWIEEEFENSEELERIVTYKLPKSEEEAYPEFKNQEIKVRLIKIPLEEKNEILCTSLLDTEIYPNEEFAEIYQMRWGIEECFKMLKTRVDLEDFSGKTARSVEQDFHAKIFLLTLCASYSHPIEEKVREEYKANEKRKYDQKINRTSALDTVKTCLIKIFMLNIVEKTIKAMDKMIADVREVIRPNRSFKRNKKPKRTFCSNYKKL